MRGNRNLGARQLWGPLTSASTPSPTVRNPACTPFELPSGGAIVFNETHTSTLTSKLVFQQPCDRVSTSNPGSSGNSTVIGLREPFYASTSPQIFAIATATVISYLLVIIIFITPRTFFVGGPGGASGSSFLGRNANAAVVGVGRRPWLQKIATVTVAISLTIATSDTFRVAEDQYIEGYTDAGLLVDDVVGSLEIRTVRVISDTFLWLAQVQTLIRLFPRHKEKVTIKWLGFALVSLDTIFSILNSFVNYKPRTRPRTFQDAIPALNYLFELAISLIYASCVIYYSISKRRYAFWHSKMRNICLVALLSFVAILIPVVFFVLDVSKPDVAGWGDYIRWVGAAAASVVVWEWVERIEVLERDEKKDGILGREIFDDDEMLDNVPSSEEVDFPGRRQYWNRNGFPTEEPQSGETDNRGGRVQALRSRILLGKSRRKGAVKSDASNNLNAFETSIEAAGVNHPAVPPQAASPISRSDNTSAGSTIYAVRYHTTDEATAHTPAVLAGVDTEADRIAGFNDASDPSSDRTAVNGEVNTAASGTATYGSSNPVNARDSRPNQMWRSVPNPFKRRRASPPAEVAAQMAASGVRRSPIDTRISVKSRFGAFTSSQRSKFGGRDQDARDETPMVTVIPAQRRSQRTWSAQDMRSVVVVMAEDPVEQRDRLELPRGASYQEGLTPDSEMPVLVIPAPRRGQRTWSPEDANQGMLYQSPYPSPAPDLERLEDGSDASSRPTGPISPGATGALISTKGSLTISEDQACNHTASRRSTYQRSLSLLPTKASPSSRSPPPVMAASASSLDRVPEQDDGPSTVIPESSPSTPESAELRIGLGRESGIAADERETDHPHRHSASDSDS